MDHLFKAVLTIPDRPTNSEFQEFVQRNKWRLVWFYPRGSFLFSEPLGNGNEFNPEQRCVPIPTKENVLILELNDKDHEDWKKYRLEEELEANRNHYIKTPGFCVTPKSKSLLHKTNQK